MVDIDRFAAILEEQAALLPKEVLKNLNLGIGVSEKAKRDRRARPGLALYILGEYHVHYVMGRGVVLYYGSFQQARPGLFLRRGRFIWLGRQGFQRAHAQTLGQRPLKQLHAARIVPNARQHARVARADAPVRHGRLNIVLQR